MAHMGHRLFIWGVTYGSTSAAEGHADRGPCQKHQAAQKEAQPWVLCHAPQTLIENGVKRKNRETMGAAYLSHKIM